MFSRLIRFLSPLNISLKDILISLAGSGILAFGLYNIHSLSGVTEGGVLGLTLLLDHWLGLSPALSSLVLNLLCYILGWRTLGRRFIVLSAVAGGSFSLWYALFEFFPPLCPAIGEYPLAAAVLGAAFVGTGVGLCVRAGGAPGRPSRRCAGPHSSPRPGGRRGNRPARPPPPPPPRRPAPEGPPGRPPAPRAPLR